MEKVNSFCFECNTVITSGPDNHYGFIIGLDRDPVCTGSGMFRLHCIMVNIIFVFFIFSRLFSYSQHYSRFKTKFVTLLRSMMKNRVL